MIGAETFWELITDPAHWGLEAVSELAFFLVEILVLDWVLHKIHPIIRPRHADRGRHTPRRKR